MEMDKWTDQQDKMIPEKPLSTTFCGEANIKPF